jgi:hypothetical protein
VNEDRAALRERAEHSRGATCDERAYEVDPAVSVGYAHRQPMSVGRAHPRGTRGDRCTRNSEVAPGRLDPAARRVDRHRASPSVHDGIDNVRQLAPGVGERVKIMFAGPTRLDQATVPQKREVMAHRGLALRAQVRA